MDRKDVLLEARSRFEGPIWSLLAKVEETLVDLVSVRHLDLEDARATGSVLNAALAGAALAANLSSDELEVIHCRSGQSRKLVGTMHLDGEAYSVVFELHQCGPEGGTSKAEHEYAGDVIEDEPPLPGFEEEAPEALLLFVACHLSAARTKIARAFLKFADGVDKKRIEIFRDAQPAASAGSVVSPAGEPEGSKLSLVNSGKEREKNGGKTDKRGDAASSS